MLETERLLLRKFTPEDLDALINLRSDDEVIKYLGGRRLQNPEAIEKRMKFYIECYAKFGFGMCAMIWRETGEMIGWSGLQPLEETGEIELGYGMIKEFWGRGIGFECARAWLKFGFETAGLERIVAVAGENVGELSVSRQSDHLVYAQLSIETNLWRIEIANREGGGGGGDGRRNASSPTKFIASTRQEEDPRFSPNGQRIAFGSSRSGKDEIWVCDREGQNPVQLTNLGGAGSPRWSPDNRFIAFDSRAGGNADIHIIGADGGSPRRLTTEASEEVVPSWSRDGRLIYFASKRTGRHEVWKMPAAGGEAVQVTREGGFTAFESTDGRVLYYTKSRSDSSLWSVSVEGGAETKVFDHNVGRGWALAERGIYFFVFPPGGTKPYTLEFFNFSTRQSTQLATLEGQARALSISTMTVSPDERWIVYAQRDQLDYDLMLVENFR